MAVIEHIFLNAEWYTILLVWIVLPLAGYFAYLRLTNAARVNEDADALS